MKHLHGYYYHKQGVYTNLILGYFIVTKAFSSKPEREVSINSLPPYNRPKIVKILKQLNCIKASGTKGVLLWDLQTPIDYELGRLIILEVLRRLYPERENWYYSLSEFERDYAKTFGTDVIPDTYIAITRSRELNKLPFTMPPPPKKLVERKITRTVIMQDYPLIHHGMMELKKMCRKEGIQLNIQIQ